MKRIAIVGSSGLIGATLTERLIARGGLDRIVPFIHSSGNAMRLARRAVPLTMLDILDAGNVTERLAGCTHVVNCSRGDNDTMLSGLKNLLAACRTHRIERFVHLSSVAVYGDPPAPESVSENAAPRAEKGSYGWIKLQQDEMVQKAARDGLPSIILCPPNISGPYSYYLVGLVDAVRAGAFALLDDGGAPCNLVDAANLSHAIELALDCGPVDGSRLFVTDGAETTWRSVVEAIAPLAQNPGPMPRVSPSQLTPIASREASSRVSLRASIKHLASSEVRAALRKDPLWEQTELALRRLVARAGKRVEDRLRTSVEGPLKVPKAASRPTWDTPLCRQQLRGVRHSCERARRLLGYEPLYTERESFAAFSAWYRHTQGMDTAVWPLLRQLY